MNLYLEVLKKYTVYTGRARRKEYWMFFLMNLVIGFVIGFVGGLLGMKGLTSVVALIFDLAILLPAIAVGIRRMHDTQHSGWWLLLPIVNIIFLATPGTQGDNEFGPDPKVQES